MTYSVRIKQSASKELAGISQPDRTRVVDAIDQLRDQPFAGSTLKGGLRGLRRLHVGDYRILYELLSGELVVLVVRVAHRRESYRRG